STPVRVVAGGSGGHAGSAEGGGEPTAAGAGQGGQALEQPLVGRAEGGEVVAVDVELADDVAAVPDEDDELRPCPRRAGEVVVEGGDVVDHDVGVAGDGRPAHPDTDGDAGVLGGRADVRPEDQRVAGQDIDADPAPGRVGAGQDLDPPAEGGLVGEVAGQGGLGRRSGFISAGGPAVFPERFHWA